MTRFLTLLLLVFLAPVSAGETCMICFNEDLGDGWIMYGCEPTQGSGTDSCKITIEPQGCHHNGACYDGEVIIGPPVPPGWINTPESPGKSMSGVDMALSARHPGELRFTLPFLIEYSNLVSQGLQPDELMKVYYDADKLVWVRMTADLALYRVTYDGARLDVQQLPTAVPSKPTITGFSLTSLRGLEVYVTFPQSDNSMELRLMRLAWEDGDGVGTLPLKNGDDVGTLPFLMGGDDVGSLPNKKPSK